MAEHIFLCTVMSVVLLYPLADCYIDFDSDGG